MSQFLEFAQNHPLLFIGAFVLVALLVMTEFKRKLLGFTEVNPNDAIKLINREEAVVLDVRADSEFNEGHIINAINIPLGLLDGRLKELDEYRERAIIICCKTGQQSAKAGKILQQQGFQKIYKLSGGMSAWSSASLPLDR